MALISPNGLWLTRANPVPSSILRPDGMIEAMATGKLILASTGDSISIASATSNIVLGGAGNPDTISIGSNLTTINGDLTINGTLDVLYVNDVVISNRVVNVSSEVPYSDATALTDGAGIVVADPASIGTTNERSIVWRAGLSNGFQGVALTEEGGASNQGCWDVSGGCLRITVPVPPGSNAYPLNSNGGQQPGYSVGRDVSYGLRVNAYDEVEIFKRVLPFSCNANPVPEQGASYRTVAKFGGAFGPNAISLPKSVNPY